jgi:putative FmdB family regulatory protein
MPFYEYQCKSCGHDLEAMQKISDPPLKKCPQCGKSQLQRLMSAPVFRLKGGGWYETDFKGDQDNKRNLADRPEDTPKDSPKDAAKEGAAATADAKGKDGKTDTAAPKDAVSKDAVSLDKSADKPAEKTLAAPAKKPDAAKKSSRGRIVSHGKSAAKRPIKRPVHKATRRV